MYFQKVVNSDVLAPIMDLPSALRHQKVQVLVFPNPKRPNKKGHVSLARLQGGLNRYADPSLRKLEKKAWALAVKEKHANR